MSENRFGPGVIGDEAFQREQVIEESLVEKFGPGVLNNPPAQPVQASAEEVELLQRDVVSDVPPPVDAPPYTSLSIAELEKELRANPAEFDRLMKGEYARPDGGRKGAWGVFLSVEQEKGEAARKEVLEALFGLLKKGGGK